MQNEHATSKAVSFRQLLIVLSMVYLLLPNLIFLFGWVKPYLAVPCSLLLIYAVVKVCRCRESATEVAHTQPFTKRDWVLYPLMLLGIFLLTELIGFHAQVRQDPDFPYRNAIYATLVCQDWPIFSERGEYFIYYHAFWLPPALLTKWAAGYISPFTALAVWSYAGLALGASLFYLALREKTILLFSLLLLTCSLSYFYHFFFHHDTGFIKTWVFFAKNHFYLTNFCLNQLRCTFNHAIPSFLFMAILLTQGVPMRFILVPAALLFTLSPMGGIALLPLLGIFIYLHWRQKKQLPINLPTMLATLPVVLTLLYLGGQQGEESASLLFMWNDSPFWICKTEPFTHLPLRLLNTVALCLSFLLPVVILLNKKLRSTPLFLALVITTILISFVWVGRHNNELLFKGSLILGILQAWLLTQQWSVGGLLRKALIVLYILCFLKFDVYAYMPILCSYSQDIAKKEINLQNEWEWNINHPEKSTYQNFFGVNKCPLFLNSQPAESKRILPAQAGSVSLFQDR